MTTPPPPPPPPPPGQPWWPGSPPAATPARRRSGWSGGRIALAVVGVLVLVGGAGALGFAAGLAVGGTTSVSGPGIVADGGDGVDLPGLTPLDVAAVTGPPLRRGGATPGQLAGPAVDHELVVETTDRVIVTASSDDFDTVLVLLDADGAVVASDDDSAGAGTDSLLDLELDPGTYTVRVQSWDGSGTGTYSVTVD